MKNQFLLLPQHHSRHEKCVFQSDAQKNEEIDVGINTRAELSTLNRSNDKNETCVRSAGSAFIRLLLIIVISLVMIMKDQTETVFVFVHFELLKNLYSGKYFSKLGFLIKNMPKQYFEFIKCK